MVSIASALLASLCVLAQPEAGERSVRALIVTGLDIPAHDWTRTAPVLRQALQSAGRCEARIVEDPEILATDLIFDYDVLVLHFYNEKPLAHEGEARANLERFLQTPGHGLVLVHFASGAFPDWPAYANLAGMVWDKVNTHDPRGPFEVRLTPVDHPVTRGMSGFATDDELYIGLAGQRPVEVLAVARSKVTGRDHPMAFAFESSPGRVFHTTLGHDARALEPPAVQALIERGAQWCAGRVP